MNITVQFFAAARDAAGCSEITIDLPEKAVVSDLKRRLESRLPALQTLSSRLLVAVNQEYADDGAVLHPGDDVACFPPVSGG